MLTCKEILDLTSQELDTSIPIFTRLQMVMHLFICKNCKRYAKQIALLHNLSSKFDDPIDRVALSKDAKQRISSILNKYHHPKK